MWKITLGFIFHRLCLYGVVLASIAVTVRREENASTLPPFAPLPSLHSRLVEKILELPETQTIERAEIPKFRSLFQHQSHPFLFLGGLLRSWLPLSGPMIAIILSNLFFMLFLREVFLLISRLSNEDSATLTGLLCVFWPTSYEYSLGAIESFDVFVLMAGIRLAVDDKWLLSGLAFGLSILAVPASIFWLPVIFAWFWFYTRHYQWSASVRRFGLAFGPTIVLGVIFFRELMTIPWGTQGALQHIFEAIKSQSISGLISGSYRGQTLSIIALAIGSGIAFLANYSFLNKAFPLYSLFAWLATTPYEQLTTRAYLAIGCFQGLASFPSTPLSKFFLSSLLGLSAWEIYHLFA